MVYEYKTEIIEDIGPEPNCNYPSEVDNYYAKINELYHVYAQATKADEYEAKAKAFDQISDKLETYDCEAHDSLNVNYHDFGADTAHVVDEMVGGFWDE